jgi:DNA relaxase NicK
MDRAFLRIFNRGKPEGDREMGCMSFEIGFSPAQIPGNPVKVYGKRI